ncbi:MAG: thioredoxin domain-containing protein [Myxococcota bacterium]|jgi:putative thioredoxin|nr:thioredoxin domain-containing protein [Myxococcota bacterium]|tara:strand:+ start:319 stop:651 length:333 start_codon:yes stop_codon:yes gene_type:complete
MPTAVIDVTDFERDVIETSSQVPVLVDFWAEWCTMCKGLSRTLEDMAEDSEGAFVLAKLNVETYPELAKQHGVQSLPTVTLYRDGEAIDSFSGQLPKMHIRSFLSRNITD